MLLYQRWMQDLPKIASRSSSSAHLKPTTRKWTNRRHWKMCSALIWMDMEKLDHKLRKNFLAYRLYRNFLCPWPWPSTSKAQFMPQQLTTQHDQTQKTNQFSVIHSFNVNIFATACLCTGGRKAQLANYCTRIDLLAPRKQIFISLRELLALGRDLGLHFLRGCLLIGIIAALQGHYLFT